VVDLWLETRAASTCLRGASVENNDPWLLKQPLCEGKGKDIYSVLNYDGSTIMLQELAPILVSGMAQLSPSLFSINIGVRSMSFKSDSSFKHYSICTSFGRVENIL
jgi:hypothetical protein